MKIRVAVLFGGKSVEHEISVISAVQAMGYLDKEKYELIPVYITKSGKLYTGEKLTAIEVIDCDHDLGDYYPDGGDGIKLIDWLAERGTYYPIRLHTMNPVGRDNMQRTIDRYWP